METILSSVHRLHSLRSLSLGLPESQPLRGCEVSIQRVVSDTDILFSVWSLTVPCKRITFACTSSPRHWVETILSSVPRLHSLRSLSLGLLKVCLRGTGCNPPSAYLDALAPWKPLSPNVGVGFIPILQAQNPLPFPKGGKRNYL